MTSVRRLERIFDQSGINLIRDTLWGYFFVATNPSSLFQLREYLAADEYQFVNLYVWNSSDCYTLHLVKLESHTPRSLARRNRQLKRVAERFGACYDGIDVGHLHQQRVVMARAA